MLCQDEIDEIYLLGLLDAPLGVPPFDALPLDASQLAHRDQRLIAEIDAMLGIQLPEMAMPTVDPAMHTVDVATPTVDPAMPMFATVMPTVDSDMHTVDSVMPMFDPALLGSTLELIAHIDGLLAGSAVMAFTADSTTELTAHGVLAQEHAPPTHAKRHLCAAPGCKANASFGATCSRKHRPVWCKHHKQLYDVRVRSYKHCRAEGCTTFPTFGPPSTKLQLHCAKHKQPDEINHRAKRDMPLLSEPL